MKKALKNFESSRNLQTATASNENVALLSKRTPAKSSSRKPGKFTGSVGVAVKVDINKPHVDYPDAFRRRFGYEEKKCFKENPLLNPRSRAETGESNLAITFFSFAMVVRLHSLAKNVR